MNPSLPAKSSDLLLWSRIISAKLHCKALSLSNGIHLVPIGDVGQTLVESDLRFDAAADAVVRAEQRVEVGVVSVQLALTICRLKILEFNKDYGYSAFIKL